MKKLYIVCLCLVLSFLLAACQETSKKQDENNSAMITTTTAVTELPGTGGDTGGCRIHQFYYHAINGIWADEHFEAFDKMYEELGKPKEWYNIVEFVKCAEIPREDFPKWACWTTHETWDGDLDKPALAQWRDCPYTYNQFLDAVYGDDAELAEWVFAYDTTKELGYY